MLYFELEKLFWLIILIHASQKRFQKGSSPSGRHLTHPQEFCAVQNEFLGEIKKHLEYPHHVRMV